MALRVIAHPFSGAVRTIRVSSGVGFLIDILGDGFFPVVHRVQPVPGVCAGIGDLLAASFRPLLHAVFKPVVGSVDGTPGTVRKYSRLVVKIQISSVHHGIAMHHLSGFPVIIIFPAIGIRIPALHHGARHFIKTVPAAEPFVLALDHPAVFVITHPFSGAVFPVSVLPRIRILIDIFIHGHPAVLYGIQPVPGLCLRVEDFLSPPFRSLTDAILIPVFSSILFTPSVIRVGGRISGHGAGRRRHSFIYGNLEHKGIVQRTYLPVHLHGLLPLAGGRCDILHILMVIQAMRTVGIHVIFLEIYSILTLADIIGSDDRRPAQNGSKRIVPPSVSRIGQPPFNDLPGSIARCVYIKIIIISLIPRIRTGDQRRTPVPLFLIYPGCQMKRADIVPGTRLQKDLGIGMPCSRRISAAVHKSIIQYRGDCPFGMICRIVGEKLKLKDPIFPKAVPGIHKIFQDALRSHIPVAVLPGLSLYIIRIRLMDPAPFTLHLPADHRTPLQPCIHSDKYPVGMPLFQAVQGCPVAFRKCLHIRIQPVPGHGICRARVIRRHPVFLLPGKKRFIRAGSIHPGEISLKSPSPA